MASGIPISAYVNLQGPIKCVAASAPYLASGGADDLIHLYNLQSDVDLGFLMSPGDGAVSAMAFHATDRSRHPSHLFSGSADGSVSVWQAGGEWTCLKTFHGHKKEVTGLAIHPSGRLALSVSADSKLRLWNLVKGKSAHESTLEIPAEHVAFSPDGASYALIQGNKVTLQGVGEAPKAILAHSRRIQCLAFPGQNVVLTGSEEGAVSLWDPRTAVPAAVITQAHRTRVKGVAPLSSSVVEQTAGLTASAASDGLVKVWDFRKTESDKSGLSKPLTKAATGARLTCLVAFNPSCASSKANMHDLPKSKEAAKHSSNEAPRPDDTRKLRASGKQTPQRKPLPDKSVTRNGVVEFPDEAAKGKQGKRKRITGKAEARNSLQASRADSSPQVRNSMSRKH